MLWTAFLDIVASQAKSWMKIRQVNMWIPISFLQTLLSGRSMLLHGEIVYLAKGTTCWQSGWNVEAYCRFPGCLCVLWVFWYRPLHG